MPCARKFLPNSAQKDFFCDSRRRKGHPTLTRLCKISSGWKVDMSGRFAPVIRVAAPIVVGVVSYNVCFHSFQYYYSRPLAPRPNVPFNVDNWEKIEKSDPIKRFRGECPCKWSVPELCLFTSSPGADYERRRPMFD